MDDAQLKLSRRTLLAAACALPAASPCVRSELRPSKATSKNREASPSVRSERSRGPSPSEAEALHTAWNRALSRFQNAEAAVAALERSPDEDAFGDAVVACNRALERLLTAPAPDLPALADKLRLAIARQAWELPAGDEAMAAIERDALRLCA